MLPVLYGLGGLIVSGVGYLIYDSSKHPAKPAPLKVDLNPDVKPPVNPNAGLGQGVQPVHITPPGVPQPLNKPVALPTVAPTVSGSTLSNAAAALVQRINTGGSGGVIPELKTFQNAYNLTNGGTKLAVDGLYGPKSQAALQAVIAPAIAPGGGSAHAVSLPSVVAPSPNTGVSINDAATALAGRTPDKTSNAETTTFQAAYNAHKPAVQLIVDGKYGPKGEQALQSVLNWMGGGAKAPKNVYGPMTGSIPVFNG